MKALYPIILAALLPGCGDTDESSSDGIQTVMHEAQIGPGYHPPIDGEMPAWGYTCSNPTGNGEICTPATIHVSDGELCTDTADDGCYQIRVMEGETLVIYWMATR